MQKYMTGEITGFNKYIAGLVDVLSAMFIFLFVSTATGKIQDNLALRFVLQKFPLIGHYANAVAIALPTLEIIVAALLLVPKTRLIGLYSFLAMMSAFTVYTAYMLMFSPKLPCTCGGLMRTLSWPMHLVFNVVVVLLAGYAIYLKKKASKSQEHIK